jgi:hypothetical protein
MKRTRAQFPTTSNVRTNRYVSIVAGRGREGGRGGRRRRGGGGRREKEREEKRERERAHVIMPRSHTVVHTGM